MVQVQVETGIKICAKQIMPIAQHYYRLITGNLKRIIRLNFKSLFNPFKTSYIVFAVDITVYVDGENSVNIRYVINIRYFINVLG